MTERYLPEGAVDCHFHLFEPPSELDANRTYSPEPAPLSAYQKMQSETGLKRGVIVQPSIYGSDNRTTLALSKNDPNNFKSIVVLPDNFTKQDVKRFADQGAVGARINPLFSKSQSIEKLGDIAEEIADFGWHLQLLVDLSQLEGWETELPKLPVPIVFDHIGHIPAQLGTNAPAFQNLLHLMDTGQFWVKLSGYYRVTNFDDVEYADVAPFVKALIGANPERLVWGSDWPHPANPRPTPTVLQLLGCFIGWANTPETVQKILVDNPEALYGFSRDS